MMTRVSFPRFVVHKRGCPLKKGGVRRKRRAVDDLYSPLGNVLQRFHAQYRPHIVLCGTSLIRCHIQGEHAFFEEIAFQISDYMGERITTMTNVVSATVKRVVMNPQHTVRSTCEEVYSSATAGLSLIVFTGRVRRGIGYELTCS